MPQVTGIGPSLYTELAFTELGSASVPTTFTAAQAVTLFGTSTATEVTTITGVREFPSFGTPANITNVPVYGSTTSVQIQAQADLPSFEVSLNYDPSVHATLQSSVGTPTQVLWRLRISNDQAIAVAAARSGSTVPTGLNFSDFYFSGYIASFEVTPSLSDSLQATMTLAVGSTINGPFSSTT